MGRLVLVGVAVPVGPVGPPRLRLVDRTALDPHALRQVVGHEARLRRRGRVGRRRPGDGHVARWARGLLPARRRLPAAGRARRSSPRRRASGRWCGSTVRAGGTTRRRRSTRRCCGWCAGWCRCPTSSRYDAASPPRTSPGSWSPRPAGRARRPAAADARRRAAAALGRPPRALSPPTSPGCRRCGPGRSSTRSSRIGDFGVADGLPGLRRRPRRRPRGRRLGGGSGGSPRARRRAGPGAARRRRPDLPRALRPQPEEPPGRPGHARR